MELAIAAIVLALVVVVVIAGPLRAGDEVDRREQSRREELEAAKEAKYREIRDAELDREMGKLSQRDWRAVDRELRAEAIAILRELDALEGRDAGREGTGGPLAG